jgi:hypothetical protein
MDGRLLHIGDLDHSSGQSQSYLGVDGLCVVCAKARWLVFLLEQIGRLNENFSTSQHIKQN